MRLMLIEDDGVLGAGLRDFLDATGHDTVWCQTLQQARLQRHEPFDALLVDWHLPDGSGLEWVRAQRRQGDTRPMLILTARDLPSDRVHGLDAGADDYLVKPFEPEELAARIRAVCRRSAQALGERLQFGDVAVDLQARCVYLDGERCDLTAREWAITEALARRAGRVVSKADLETLVGMDGGVQSNSLEVHISGIRRKLGRDFIETLRGLGYRINRDG